MKRIIPFIMVILVALVAFFGLQHFNGNKAPAEVKEEISLPELTIETASVQEEATEPEVTPTPEPTATSEPTATPEPTVDPQLYVCLDKESGKTFYQAASEEVLLARVRESISAEQAVDAVECVNYAAMQVVSHDDERIIEGITAYDLIKDEAELKVTFNRNSDKLYVCGEKDFKPSGKADKTFKGLSDKKAYGAWICSEHQAFKASALVYEGYPKSEGYRGPFSVADGFSAKVLKSIVLINTEADRYDWVLVMCDCGEEVSSSDNGTGGNDPQDPDDGNEPQDPDDGNEPQDPDDGKPEYSPEPDEDEVYDPEYSPEPDEDEVYGDEPVVSDDQDAIVRPPVEEETTTPEYSPEVDVYGDEPEYSEPQDVYSTEESASEVEAEVSSEQDIFVRPESEPVDSAEEYSEPEYSEPVAVYSSVEEYSEPEYSEPIGVYSEEYVAEVSSEENIFAR